MNWQAYRVVFALRSPLHAGYRKLGNIQQTRPYLVGKILWAALTARLTRDGPESDGDYVKMGNRVERHLAFSYFYPTTHEDGQVMLWPWGTGETEHRYQFLDSYASTAKDYARNAAEEASLHEIECIRPHTRVGKAVYLSGYVMATDNAPAGWKQALYHLQLGGERGYGWGRVEPVGKPQLWEDPSLFGWHIVKSDTWPPVLRAEEEMSLCAHALAADFSLTGIDGGIEPLVGRETKPDGKFGAHISRARICYVPGSIVPKGTHVQIGPYGIWEAV